MRKNARSMGNRRNDEDGLEALRAAASGRSFVEALLAVCNHDERQLTGFPMPHSPTIERFTGLLERAIDDRADLAGQFFPIAADLVSQLKVKPVVQVGSRGFTLGYEHKFPNVDTVLNFGILLLLDISKPFGERLARCRRFSCRRFYIAQKNPKGGGYNMKYCVPEHRTESNNRKENRKPRKPK